MIKRRKQTKKRKLNTGAAVGGSGSSEDEDAEGSEEEEDDELPTQVERMPDVQKQKQKEITPVPPHEDMQMPLDEPTLRAEPTEGGGISEERFVLQSSPS